MNSPAGPQQMPPGQLIAWVRQFHDQSVTCVQAMVAAAATPLNARLPLDPTTVLFFLAGAAGCLAVAMMR